MREEKCSRRKTMSSQYRAYGNVMTVKINKPKRLEPRTVLRFALQGRDPCGPPFSPQNANGMGTVTAACG
jgi:hypothetical protein